MLELYLIRHGLAGEYGSYANDAERPLTDEGDRKTQRIAARLRDLDLKFDLILTSPYRRASQTAEILQSAGLGSLEVAEFLQPEGQFDDWMQWFESWRSPDKTLALVGHQPNLSDWAEQLVWGSPAGRLALKKAGVIGLALPDKGSPVGNSTLFWLTPPRFLL